MREEMLGFVQFKQRHSLIHFCESIWSLSVKDTISRGHQGPLYKSRQKMLGRAVERVQVEGLWGDPWRSGK